MTPEWLREVVRTALDARIRECRRPPTGALAETYCLALEGASAPARAVCKRAGASVWTGDVVEPEVVRLVGAETALPVPEVLASGSLEGVAGPARWALYEYRDGRRPETGIAGRRAELAAEAGRLLGRLHASRALEFDRRGGLERAGTGLEVRPAASAGVLDSRLARRVAPVGPATAPAVAPVLDHGDFRPANLLVDEDGVAAVLDWGNAHVTHPGFALARAEVRFADLAAGRAGERRALRERFRAAYARRSDLPDAVRAALPRFKALWVLQAAANVAGVARRARGRRQLWRQLRERATPIAGEDVFRTRERA